MKVVIYHSSVPNDKNLEKLELLKNFSKGVKKYGDECIDLYGHSVHPSDVGVIQGWITEETKIRRHLLLRHDVINYANNNKKYVISADSNLFLYADTSNEEHYLRYSFNGIFPNTGIYCDTVINPDRWKKISNDLNLTLKDYKTNGDHILLCLQRNGGWSMAGYDVQDWSINTITEIRKYTDRPIIIRGHPGDKAAKVYLDPESQACRIKGFHNVHFSSFKRTLLEDLENCWAVVNYNSSPVVGAAIEGYPIFVTDPDRSQCKEIANTDLKDIENPNYPDRQKWVERISMFHWNFDELLSGECWEHMRKFVSSSVC